MLQSHLIASFKPGQD